MTKIKTITDVVDWRLCIGCGACAYICPQRAIRLENFVAEGIRPVVDESQCGTCTDCLEVCPAVATDFSATSTKPPGALEKEWGPVLQVWEGHATDPEIRYRGSSGGALTALAAFCLEQADMHGVLHTGADPEFPILNATKFSRTREQLTAAVGSRYSPASICEGLGDVEAAAGPCAVIGKPGEIAAARNAARLRPALARNLGVTMSFFCAETPSTAGTLALLKKHDVDPVQVTDLRFRGNGWPGHFAAVRKGDTEPTVKLTYRDSWAFLQAFRPWSVHLWPDGSGELADISCGDPWHKEPDGKNPGISLIVARTTAGRTLVEAAIRAGYLQATVVEPTKIGASQPGLLAKKGAIWGRRLASRLVGLPVTRFHGAHLAHCWARLSLGDKFRSTVGTLRRIFGRKLHRRLDLSRQSRATELRATATARS